MRTRIGLKEAIREVKAWPVSEQSRRQRIEWLKELDQRAKTIGGYIQKIVWDAEDGYPEHAWGFVQHTVRPYRQGYGCDGTTDGNIHLIAMTLCERIGIDYAQAYEEAYPGNGHDWLLALPGYKRLLDETVIPDTVNDDTLVLVLSDLYQINNRSLVEVLSNKMTEKGYRVKDWWKREDSLRASSRAA